MIRLPFLLLALLLTFVASHGIAEDRSDWTSWRGPNSHGSIDRGSFPSRIDAAKSVILARMHQGESWLAAFDKATGELQWKVARNYEVPVPFGNRILIRGENHLYCFGD